MQCRRQPHASKDCRCDLHHRRRESGSGKSSVHRRLVTTIQRTVGVGVGALRKSLPHRPPIFSSIGVVRAPRMTSSAAEQTAFRGLATLPRPFHVSLDTLVVFIQLLFLGLEGCQIICYVKAKLIERHVFVDRRVADQRDLFTLFEAPKLFPESEAIHPMAV